jgi:hypothetical protein
LAVSGTAFFQGYDAGVILSDTTSIGTLEMGLSSDFAAYSDIALVGDAIVRSGGLMVWAAI